jgi:ATP-dependent DNA helicase RecG
MKLAEIIKQPEGRKLEFKEILPNKSDLAKTIVAFATDAGGEMYIGIKDNPREVIGLEEDELIALEEKISNIIHDQCAPNLLPEITFLRYKDRHIIKILIHKGNNPPFHLKSKGIQECTFIRVGSSSRQANTEIINELERQKKNVSFDSELIHLKSFEELKIDSLKELYRETTGEELTNQVLKKLELFETNQGRRLATNALVLLSDDKLKKELFPYAKIECARFKGTIPGNFIDQKTIDGQVGLQADLAYQFVLRHISEGTIGYEGVYRKDRWEYPIMAIREIIRNAVIHRNYSLTGKDIKIAIFDDKIEITSPGKLLPSVDYEDMESGQSDIRNKILAPVFKRMGIIEQWGKGLQLISDELENYPEIELKWKEPGLAFRVSFVKKNYKKQDVRSVEDAKDVSVRFRNDFGMISERIRNDFGKDIANMFDLLLQHPEYTAEQIAKKINKTSRTVESYLSKLKQAKIIERRGAKLGEYWEIIKNNHE